MEDVKIEKEVSIKDNKIKIILDNVYVTLNSLSNIVNKLSILEDIIVILNRTNNVKYQIVLQIYLFFKIFFNFNLILVDLVNKINDHDHLENLTISLYHHILYNSDLVINYVVMVDKIMENINVEIKQNKFLHHDNDTNVVEDNDEVSNVLIYN